MKPYRRYPPEIGSTCACVTLIALGVWGLIIWVAWWLLT